MKKKVKEKLINFFKSKELALPRKRDDTPNFEDYLKNFLKITKN